MQLIDKRIIAIGYTEGEGTVVLINKKDMNNSAAKCCTYEYSSESLSCHESIANVTKFNNILSVEDNHTSMVLIQRANRSLKDEEVATINDHLLVG